MYTTNFRWVLTQFLIAIFILPAISYEILGQAEGVHIVDLGYEQMKGEAMKAVGDEIYIAGQVVEWDVQGKYNIHLSKFDLMGNPIRSKVWYNPDDEDFINDHSDNNDLVIIDDRVYLATYSIGEDCLVSSDLQVSDFYTHLCYDHPEVDEGNVMITKHAIEFPKDHISVISRNSERTQLPLVVIDKDDSSDYTWMDIGDKLSTRKYSPFTLLISPLTGNFFPINWKFTSLDKLL